MFRELRLFNCSSVYRACADLLVNKCLCTSETRNFYVALMYSHRRERLPLAHDSLLYKNLHRDIPALYDTGKSGKELDGAPLKKEYRENCCSNANVTPTLR